MSEIKILYVDDVIDISLSRYLVNKYKNNYSEYRFDCSKSYEELLKSKEVQESNIIIIDSRLFEDRDAKNKYTGEQFKIILKKLFPFIEVIVITQNQVTEKNTLKKYNSSKINSADEYYESVLAPKIAALSIDINEFRSIAEKLSPVKYDKVLVENIKQSLEGINEYDQLKSSDIDSLIKAFKELQEKIDG